MVKKKTTPRRRRSTSKAKTKTKVVEPQAGPREADDGSAATPPPADVDFSDFELGLPSATTQRRAFYSREPSGVLYFALFVILASAVVIVLSVREKRIQAGGTDFLAPVSNYLPAVTTDDGKQVLAGADKDEGSGSNTIWYILGAALFVFLMYMYGTRLRAWLVGTKPPPPKPVPPPAPPMVDADLDHAKRLIKSTNVLPILANGMHLVRLTDRNNNVVFVELPVGATLPIIAGNFSSLVNRLDHDASQVGKDEVDKAVSALAPYLKARQRSWLHKQGVKVEVTSANRDAIRDAEAKVEGAFTKAAAHGLL